ncbi:hypothetical protein GUA87_06330 [Sneathiella sp. P13V-1]|uniref:DUF2946 family protein n=1 Tax=Sneathiella sp. P13V-1 TaxID=2697366 RepID=UPI00187B32EB|nr:DUF2946 family protein [Sneathiella sp. P13V-1]MBE7636456.1 hypothetical protein [Sneathiella sp. P13V-1]
MSNVAEIGPHKPLKHTFNESRKGVWGRVFAFLAILAISLNLMVPMTHSAYAAAASGSDFIEVCTKNGIELVSAKEIFGEEQQAAADAEPCDACPDCPLCWFGGNVGVNNVAVVALAQKQLISSGISLSEEIGFSSPPFWGYPALRAPPETV